MEAQGRNWRIATAVCKNSSRGMGKREKERQRERSA